MTFEDPIADSVKLRKEAGGILFIVPENQKSQENGKNEKNNQETSLKRK